MDGLGLIRSNPFVIISGDVISTVNLSAVVAAHKKRKAENSLSILTVVLSKVQAVCVCVCVCVCDGWVNILMMIFYGGGGIAFEGVNKNNNPNSHSHTHTHTQVGYDAPIHPRHEDLCIGLDTHTQQLIVYDNYKCEDATHTHTHTHTRSLEESDEEEDEWEGNKANPHGVHAGVEVGLDLFKEEGHPEITLRNDLMDCHIYVCSPEVCVCVWVGVGGWVSGCV
jgi:hypothetical protein